MKISKEAPSYQRDKDKGFRSPYGECDAETKTAEDIHSCALVSSAVFPV